MLTIQNYVRPQSLEEAYTLNQNKRNRIIGGMLWLKMTDATVPTAIDLCDLGLNTIEESEDAFSIGAMVTLRQLEQNEALAACFNNCPALAVRDIVGVQFRNLATVGGSIYGRYGFSDVLTVLLSLDTYVELYKGGILPLEEYAAMAYDRDILVRLIVKKHPGRFTYLAMRNSRTDFPVLTCALSLMEGEYRAVIGARPGKAMVIRDTRGLLADGINQQSAKAFADYVADTVPTQSNLRGSSAYRTHLARVLTERGLMNLEDNNGN